MVVCNFEIHEQLLADCHRLGKVGCSHLLLHRNSTLAWFILVPETDVADLLDLADEDRTEVVGHAAAVSGFVKREMHYSKVNFASLGNVVPQMHLHVIGRRPGDACWPSPVWGNLDDGVDYTPEQVASLKDNLKSSIDLFVEQ